ncbi:hypothetical protein LPB72_17395 [Hydrogenophaga crassostreae]|uniref:EGF-like domain-containing protein n=2 Tax=Hydrogenophaga crassostreae TaxID=1763535 RepID=A0A162SSI2_9BURK|nr:hypothetical protein [Hydrogenophaga crassostreae]AOW12776.1 hypothetical protein LPB072_07900 [Hydrogenophaga crassostreae]OAD39964.1 hypothetical protein LPB72_17395 [Hydrogenophaga crassostreae]
MTPAFLLAVFAGLFAISSATAATNTGSGGANFTCSADAGLCECEGSKDGADCKAMRRNCKDIDDIFSTASPEDKGKFFCVMVKQTPGGAKSLSERLRPKARAPETAAGAPAAKPSGRSSAVSPAARSGVTRSEP